MKRWIAPLFCLALVPVGAPCAAEAAVSVPHGSVDIISENESIALGRSFDLGLHFQLEPGWHIYWLNPGDSGQPPQVAWNLPKGIIAGEIQWPAPRRLGTSSIVDFGYTGGVTLIVPMRASAELSSRQAAKIVGNLRVLVCREICVPGKAELSFSIPVKHGPPASDPRTNGLLAAARKSLPKPAPAAWRFRATETGDAFVLHATVGRQVTQATFFPLEESEIDNAAPQVVNTSAQGFQMNLKKSDQLQKPIAHLKGVVELSSDQAFTIDAPVVHAGFPGKDR